MQHAGSFLADWARCALYELPSSTSWASWEVSPSLRGAFSCLWDWHSRQRHPRQILQRSLQVWALARSRTCFTGQKTDRKEEGPSSTKGVCAGISTSTSLSTKGRPTSPRRSGFVAVVNAARILHKELGSSPRVRIHPAGRLLATFRVCTVSATMLV